MQLVDKPIASYNGGVDGLPATQPAAGQRLDLASQDVNAYNTYLVQKQTTVQAAVAGARAAGAYRYSTALPLGVHMPGLFVGSAGVGYQLLRTARPDLLPSVLAFETTP